MAPKRAGRPKVLKPKAAAKADKPWRLHAHTVGMTWSCPVDAEVNPIPDRDALVKAFTDQWGSNEHITCTEPHENGKDHYHAWVKFHVKINTYDVRCFDYFGVHPEIKFNPTVGWQNYCAKQGDYSTNFFEMCVFKQALTCATVQEAMDLIAEKKPQEFLRFHAAIEAGLRKRLSVRVPAKVYFGPFEVHFWPMCKWNPYTHSLLLWGPPGGMKTQFARYLMHHTVGQYEYVKGSHEAVKRLTGTLPFVHDEIYLCRPTDDPTISREITDVEAGGDIPCRNTNAFLPPGLPRIFVSNYEHPFKNPMESVYGRRVMSHNIYLNF